MRLRWFLLAALVVSAVLVAVVLRDRAPVRSEYCTVSVEGARVQLDLEQAQWASLMAAIGQQRGLPPRATSIAIIAAFQESKIHNLDYGDRDSLGLFQQRPSQGWGTSEQILDPHYAIGRFYDALVKVKGYTSMPLNDAAQLVQRSGYPSAYAKHEAASRAMASALRGYSPAAFTCQINPGVNGSSQRVSDDVTKAFGRISVAVGQDGLRFPLGGDEANRSVHGWALAQYVVANAKRLGVREVAFAGRTWSADHSPDGWRKHGSSSTTAVTVGLK